MTCDSDRYENNTGEIMKKRVLVVDDEKEILAILKRFLIRIGYEPFTTDSWETAMEHFYEESFDLAVLDVHMPERDGFQIAKEMKTAKPEQKILIFTGLDPSEAYGYLSHADVEVDDLLYKPFCFRKMQRVIEHTLGDA